MLLSLSSSGMILAYMLLQEVCRTVNALVFVTSHLATYLVVAIFVPCMYCFVYMK